MTSPLALAASPYLRQHAKNPVQWYPWCAAAFARAKAENKPILLSVGYSSCFWCHVMEREVFENPSIATLMNTFFINIKLDREEYPDIDEIYMVARQLLTNEGGWPNNVFLTPDLQPFFAGGTFGPGESYGRPAFPRLLEELASLWHNNRSDVDVQARELTAAMQQLLVPRAVPASAVLMDIAAATHEAFMQLSKFSDDRAGGFFQAPKFPQENYLIYLLGYYRVTRSARAREMVTNTLHRMAAGGIYDHVGGGFHRYAVDKDWQVPHFEKMLYTQALLGLAYTEHYAATNDPYTGDIARSVMEFVGGPFTSPDGAFYTAIDAESEQVEGEYYVWDPSEVTQLLKPEEVAFLGDIYTLAAVPVHRGMNSPSGRVLHARAPLPEAAAQRELSYTMLAGHAARCFNILLEARNKRVAPTLDDKILVGWNGLMIAALARAAKVFGKPAYRERAEKAARFALNRCRLHDGTLAHEFAADKPQLPALLEDYAYLVSGLLALASAGDSELWRKEAEVLMREAHEKLWDTESGGYFASGRDDLRIIRVKTVEDGVLPSPNAIMLHNLINLFEMTGNSEWKATALQAENAFAAHIMEAKRPTEITHWLAALNRLHPQDLEHEVVQSGVRRVPDASVPLVELATKLLDAKGVVDGEQQIAITLRIAEGWHINGVQTHDPSLVPTQIDARGEGVETILGLTIAPPEMRKLTYSGQVAPVYSGTVNGILRVRLKKQGRPITLHLSCQPCNDKACLPVMHAMAELSGELTH